MSKQTAAELMEQFIECGAYGEMKRVENQLSASKSYIKHQLYEEDGRRFPFDRYELVARFVPKFIYGWDHKGVLDYLTDYVMLEVLIQYGVYQLDQKAFMTDYGKDSLEPYEKALGYYVKPNMNKEGSKRIKQDSNEGVIEQFQSMKQALHQYYLHHRIETHLKEQYEELKADMYQCEELKEKKKVPHTYGSVSLVKKKPKYNLYQMLEEFGEEQMVEYGKVNTTKLEELAKMGFFNWKDVEPYRTLKDHRVDFMVMDFESERKMFEGMQANEQRIIERKVR